MMTWEVGYLIYYRVNWVGLFEQLFYWMDRRQSEGRGAALTHALVIAKAKSDSLQNIKNLNLWGNDLEDLRLIRQMPSLEVLSLSVNKISSLRDFGYCPKLRQLFLRKNNIHDIGEIRHLVDLRYLTELWLHDNPCANVNGYREIVIKTLPNLLKLDNVDVSMEERKKAQSVQFDLNQVGQGEEEGYGRGRESEYGEKRPGTGSREVKSREAIGKESYQRQVGSRQQQRHHQYEFDEDEDRQENKYQRDQPPSFNKPLPNFQEKQPSPKPFQREPRKQPPRVSPHYQQTSPPGPTERNKHILLAVMTLLKQLDQQSLQIVGAEVDKLLN